MTPANINDFRKLLLFVLIVLFSSMEGSVNGSEREVSPFSKTKNLGVSFQGRIRPLESFARLWLYDFYHQQTLKKEHLAAFDLESTSALELLFKTHFMGHAFMDDAPLFWIHYADLKSLLGLDPNRARFSYNELFNAILTNQTTNARIIGAVLPYEFAKNFHSPLNRSGKARLELEKLAPGLVVAYQNGSLTVSDVPKLEPSALNPWKFLKKGMRLTGAGSDLALIEKEGKWLADEIMQLIYRLQRYTVLSESQQGGSLLKMLPSRLNDGELVSLNVLESQAASKNFTSYSDELFLAITKTYQTLAKAARTTYLTNSQERSLVNRQNLQLATHDFVREIEIAYLTIAGKIYRKAMGKHLTYPMPFQLELESLYYRLPVIEISLMAYLATLILFLIAYTLKKKALQYVALGTMFFGFAIHTLILTVRCFILERPPVSNMFETVIYVPWIGMLLGIGFFIIKREQVILIAATTASVVLLILLKLTHMDASLENVQAVLDSQYWLIVHVLMIVGSYGVFIVSGVLAHFYLILSAMGQNNKQRSQLIAKSVLHTMYIGTALLIPGTILGGVWAAESWGRFWDWDPKESWAFISACVYLLVIHSYTFKKIDNVGLAIGAIVGLLAISFTWYGVNYILGTGLHSYGFGSGGEVYYYSYLIAEAVFLLGTTLLTHSRKSPIRH